MGAKIYGTLLFNSLNTAICINRFRRPNKEKVFLNIFVRNLPSPVSSWSCDLAAQSNASRHLTIGLAQPEKKNTTFSYMVA
jgi:hypothetical protein